MQHGDLDGWKFNYPVAQHFSPFLGLVHAPFLKILGLRGLYFSFSLVLLPLSIKAVYAFIREFTGDRRWATYGALTFLAIPFVNAQPFARYIDFAVIGAFAFFLHALLRVRRETLPRRWSLLTLALATFIFSMSRQQSPYLAIVFAVVLVGLDLLSQLADEVEPPRLGSVLTLIAPALIGLVPAAVQQLTRLRSFGSPIYPYQFDLLGITSPA